MDSNVKFVGESQRSKKLERDVANSSSCVQDQNLSGSCVSRVWVKRDRNNGLELPEEESWPKAILSPLLVFQ